MKTRVRIATAAVIAAVGLPIATAPASAYSISGGAYTAVGVNHTATVGGGVYTVSCGTSTFSGVASGAPSTSFTPSASGCTFFGFPVTTVQAGSWDFTVIGTNGFGDYYARVDIPVGTSATSSVPLAGCTTIVEGPQSFEHGINGNIVQLRNVPGGVEVEAMVNDVSYTASGCPFSSGTDLAYNTNGVVTAPGVSVP